MKKRNNPKEPLNHGQTIRVIQPIEVKRLTIKPDDEYVSIVAYDMLSRAFDTAMDEIATLRAKLRIIQEVIKE